jgi:hypothetical protein
VRLEVDLLPLANWTFPPETNTLSVPALAAGNSILAEAVSFEVGPAVTASTFTIPANSKVALAMLVGLMLSLGHALSRRRAWERVAGYSATTSSSDDVGTGDSMKSMTTFAMLVLASVASSGTAGELGYKLRTVPAIPQAGVPFMAAFDSDECVDWMLLPDAEPPLVTVQGNLVHLEVDRISVANCSNQPFTNTLNIPALPAGAYQLELIGRAYQSPGNDLLVETVCLSANAICSSVNFDFFMATRPPWAWVSPNSLALAGPT